VRPARRIMHCVKPSALLPAVLLLATLALADGTVAGPALTPETYASLRSAVAATPGESAWREVGWRPTFGAAVAEARRARKPIFLWAMNGHPLACV
jgi:hypothetical protein